MDRNGVDFFLRRQQPNADNFQFLRKGHGEASMSFGFALPAMRIPAILSVSVMPRLRRAQLLAHLHRQLKWSEIDQDYLQRLVAMARDEDMDGAGLRRPPLRKGDSTTNGQALSGGGTADLVAREEMVVCGLKLLPMVLAAYGKGCTVKTQFADGAIVPAGTVLATIAGQAPVLLSAERPLLNFLQRLSGIATITRRHVEALGDSSTRLLDTRKTTPGWRMLEKYAVACGGACNHRLGLFDRVMLKDNHLAAAGATAGQRLADAVRRAREATPDLPIEVEVDALEQIAPVVEAGADIILLDNFTPARIREAVKLIAGRAFTEASGGVTLRSLPGLSRLGLDFISTGALVHHSVWIDIGLDWRS
jgi:nicotinate-nucleotide pyrophosphorylase (carboxylating)